MHGYRWIKWLIPAWCLLFYLELTQTVLFFLLICGSESFQKPTAPTSDLQFFQCLSDKGIAGAQWESSWGRELGCEFTVKSSLHLPVPRAHNLSLPLVNAKRDTHLELLNVPNPVCRTAFKHPVWVCTTSRDSWGMGQLWKSSWRLFLLLMPSTCCCWTHEVAKSRVPCIAGAFHKDLEWLSLLHTN